MADMIPTSSESHRPAAIPTLDYGRPGNRWPMSEKVLDVLKTLAWVAPLTILIWIYAEREQTFKTTAHIPIDVRIAAKDRIVTMKEPTNRDIFASLSGPQTGVQRVLDAHATVQITMDPKSNAGEQLLPASLIAANPIFIQNGVTVQDIAPPFLRVQVDDIKEKMLPVRATGEVKNLVGDVLFSPAQVKVRAPESVFKLAMSQDKMYVTAELSKLDGLKQPGKREVRFVPVKWEFAGENITIEPGDVTVSAEINKPDDEFTIASIPIWPAGPPTIVNKYRIVPKDDSIANVRVVGPKDQIELLRKDVRDGGGYTPRALLYVTTDDKGKGEKALRFDLPPGVRVTNEYTVSFSLVERTAE